MMLRKTNTKDIASLLEIIEDAKTYFKENNIPQWQDNYPNEDTILKDIKNNSSYVLESNEKIVATTAISFNGEPTYKKIYEGAWLTKENNYAVIHRLAVSSKEKRKGYASKLIEQVELLSLNKSMSSIRVDTHCENIAMRSILEKFGFKYCGIIYLDDGDERVAYEKIL